MGQLDGGLGCVQIVLFCGAGGCRAGFPDVLLTSCRAGSSRAAGAAGGPGGYRVQVLVAADIDAARADLAARGAEVSDVFHDATGVFHPAGTTARVAGPAPGRKSYGSFISFDDPDGNGWLVQEITIRLPGR